MISITSALSYTVTPLQSLQYISFKQETVIDGCDYLNSDVVRSSFIGDGIAYNIADCQQVMLFDTYVHLPLTLIRIKNVLSTGYTSYS